MLRHGPYSMRVLEPSPSIVTGTALRRVARIRLAAGSWDIDCELGSPAEVSTATMIVRPIGGATALTFTSALYPARLASQRLTLVSASEIEFVVQNSSANRGQAVVADIRIAAAPLQLWANNISVRLASPVAIDATSVVLAEGAGSQIGLSPTGGQFFLVSLVSGTLLEVVRCTARSGDTLTVTRSQEGTTARAWQVSGTNVVISATATTLSTLQAGL